MCSKDISLHMSLRWVVFKQLGYIGFCQLSSTKIVFLDSQFFSWKWFWKHDLGSLPHNLLNAFALLLNKRQQNKTIIQNETVFCAEEGPRQMYITYLVCRHGKTVLTWYEAAFNSVMTEDVFPCGTSVTNSSKAVKLAVQHHCSCFMSY